MSEPAQQVRPERLELKGFNRTLAEIEWLLLILVLLYLVLPAGPVDAPLQVVAAAAAFGASIILFRYLNLFTDEARWKLAVETWIMIVLTAFVVWQTGKAESPLLPLYLLVIVYSALTLGKLVTLLEVGLVAALYLHASYAAMGSDLLSYETFSRLMLNFAPFVLVAYLTSLLAADMDFARGYVRRLSETDELTGVLNMRGFVPAMEDEMARAQRQGTSFSIMMVDVDHLKTVNDRLGHDAGNDLLRRVVDGIRRGTRSTDVVGRYGGDEFVVLLPDTDEPTAGDVADRIRRAIANSAFDVDGEQVSTTVSIGLASYIDPQMTHNDLLSRADRALYRSKAAGRDQVQVYEAT